MLLLYASHLNLTNILTEQNDFFEDFLTDLADKRFETCRNTGRFSTKSEI